MKKIIIVYYPKSQYHLVDTLINRMRKKGIEIDGFCFPLMQFHSGKKLPANIKLLGKLPHNRLTLYILRTFFFTYIIRSVTKDYDIIDVHSFERWYVSFLKKCQKPFKLTIWGSDFYRENEKWQEKKRELYKKASIIQVETSSVKKDLIAYEPTLNNKIIACNFGVDILEEIDKYRDSDDMPLLRSEGKIVVTCGYNGTLNQQHLKILSSISKLRIEIKEKIHLCIPVTYGLTSANRNSIISQLQTMDIPYSFLENRLSDYDLAKLRLESDIVVNIQTTDSLSASLIQHLYAGSILLAGDWLPYDIYDEYSLVYYPIKEKNLTNKLEDVICNITTYKDQIKDNYLKIRKFATWEAVEDKQANIYNNLLHNWLLQI